MTTTKQPRCNRKKTNIMPFSRTTHIPIYTAVVAVILSRLVGRREMGILSFRRNPFSDIVPRVTPIFLLPLCVANTRSSSCDPQNDLLVLPISLLVLEQLQRQGVTGVDVETTILSRRVVRR